jgi:type IV pilus assembly protein PilM
MMLRRERSRGISHKCGLDIGSHTIKGVEVVERGSEIVIRSAGSVSTPQTGAKERSPDRAALVQAIKSLWASAQFRAKDVVLALPPEDVYIKWLHLEPTDEEDLGNIARATAARGAPFPAQDAIIDYRVISSQMRTSRKVYFVMLVAASSSAVGRLLDVAERAGLEPLAVDMGADAAVRSFEAQRRTVSPLWGRQPRAHCIIGAGATTIAVVRGGTLEFVRTVPVGGNDFTECVAEAAGVDWQVADRMKMNPGTRLNEDDAAMMLDSGGGLRIPCGNLVSRLARETQRSLRFFSSQFAEGSYLGMIGTATLSGGGSLLRGIDACLRQYGLEAKSVINPFAGFPVDADGSGIQQVGDQAAAYTTAMGLAIGDYSSASSGAEATAIAA